MPTIIRYGDGTQKRFEVPGSFDKTVYVGGVLTTPAFADTQSVTLPTAPGVNVPVQIDYTTVRNAGVLPEEATSHRGLRAVLVGDSLTAQNNIGVLITTITRLNGVVTVVTGSAHQMRDGQRCNVSGTGTMASAHVRNQPITYISSTSFSYPNAGPNESAATGGVLCQNLLSQTGDWVWANALLGGRMRLSANLGIGGETSASILARYDEAIATSADIVWLRAGTNDVIQDVPYATTIANIESMVRQAVLGERLVVIHTLPPFAGATYWTAARNANLQNINQWIRRLATRYRGVVVVDDYRALVSPTDAVNGYGVVARYQASDTVHYNGLGALAIGRLAYTALVNIIPAVDNRVTSATDNYGFNAANRDLHDRAPWTATGGTVTAPATGVSPTGWIVEASGAFTAAPAASCPARADGLGYDIQVVTTPSTASTSFTVRTDAVAQNVRMPLFAGRKYRWVAEVAITGASGANIRYVQMTAVCQAASSAASGQIAAAISGNNTAAQNAIDSDGTFLFTSAEFEVPAGPTYTNCSMTFQVMFGGAGTACTVKIGSVRLQPMDDF